MRAFVNSSKSNSLLYRIALDQQDQSSIAVDAGMALGDAPHMITVRTVASGGVQGVA